MSCNYTATPEKRFYDQNKIIFLGGKSAGANTVNRITKNESQISDTRLHR